MAINLLSFRVCGPRAELQARQCVRQLAGLLGFEPVPQAVLAAEVFAWLRLQRRSNRRRLEFAVADRCLTIDIDGERRSVPLPESMPQAVEDVGWMMRELHRRVPFRVMDELQAHNRALLAAARLLAMGPVQPKLRVSDPAA